MRRTDQDGAEISSVRPHRGPVDHRAKRMLRTEGNELGDYDAGPAVSDRSPAPVRLPGHNIRAARLPVRREADGQANSMTIRMDHGLRARPQSSAGSPSSPGQSAGPERSMEILVTLIAPS